MTDAFAQLQELVVKQRCRDEASIMGVINENKDAFLSKKLDIDAPATQNVGNKSTLLHSAVWFRNKSVVDGLLSCRAEYSPLSDCGSAVRRQSCAMRAFRLAS